MNDTRNGILAIVIPLGAALLLAVILTLFPISATLT